MQTKLFTEPSKKEIAIAMAKAGLLSMTLLFTILFFGGISSAETGNTNNSTNLDLTEEQRNKINQLQKKNTNENTKIGNELYLKRLKLWELNQAETPNTDRIKSVREKIGELRNKQNKLRTNYRDSCRGLLTEKQLERNPNAFRVAGPGNNNKKPGGGYGNNSDSNANPEGSDNNTTNNRNRNRIRKNNNTGDGSNNGHSNNSVKGNGSGKGNNSGKGNGNKGNSGNGTTKKKPQNN